METRVRASRRLGRGFALLAAMLLPMGAGPGRASSQDAPAARAVCVFTNPAFAGKCTETTGVPNGSTPARACDAILQCLNNVDCLRTYCQATTVRTGWKLESAKAADAK
jgi:hypothetical protein